MKLQKSLALALPLALIGAGMAGAHTETAAAKSQKRAQVVLDAAVEAIGGADALQSLETVRIRSNGSTAFRLQAPTAQPPYEQGEFWENIVLDLKDNRIAAETKTNGAGFRGDNKAVVKGNEGTNVNLFGKTYTPVTQQQINTPQYGQYYRRVPALILRNASNAPMTLRYLGEDSVNGKKHDVITFVQSDNSQIALYIDSASKLLTKYEVIYQDPLNGVDASEIFFNNYKTVGQLKTPTEFFQRQGGDDVSRRTLEISYNDKVEDSVFAVDTTGLALAPNPNPRQVTVNKLAEGVYNLEGFSNGNYNVLAVEFKDHVLAVEAPVSSQVAEAAIKRIKELVPNKPIRYAAITHHHGDHMGGIRAFIAEGSTIVTTPENVGLVKQYATAKQNDALAKGPKPLKLETISNQKRVFTDGEQVVELYDIGPNPHAKEMVVAYFPKHRILFQGDLFFVSFDGGPTGPAQAGTIHLAQRVKELGLSVERIAAVHGKTSTMTELAQSVAEAQGSARAAADSR